MNRLRGMLLAIVGLAYAVSIPWYREPGSPAGTFLGLPDWAGIAAAAYVVAAIANAAAWWATRFDGEDEE